MSKLSWRRIVARFLENKVLLVVFAIAAIVVWQRFFEDRPERTIVPMTRYASAEFAISVPATWSAVEVTGNDATEIADNLWQRDPVLAASIVDFDALEQFEFVAFDLNEETLNTALLVVKIDIPPNSRWIDLGQDILPELLERLEFDEGFEIVSSGNANIDRHFGIWLHYFIPATETYPRALKDYYLLRDDDVIWGLSYDLPSDANDELKQIVAQSARSFELGD